jgi:hypothetical protein
MQEKLRQVQMAINSSRDPNERLAFESLKELLERNHNVSSDRAMLYLQRVQHVLNPSNRGESQRDRMLRYLNSFCHWRLGRDVGLEYQPSQRSIQPGAFGIKRRSSSKKRRGSRKMK